MKKLLKPASLAFYFLMFVVFFFIGIYIAGFIGAGKSQMLAGGAIVLGWGVLFAAMAFFASFFIAYYVQHKRIIRLNWILLILLAILYGITHFRYIERQKEKEKEKIKTDQPKKERTKPIMYVKPITMRYDNSAYKETHIVIKTKTIQTSGSKMGMGFLNLIILTPRHFISMMVQILKKDY